MSMTARPIHAGQAGEPRRLPDPCGERTPLARVHPSDWHRVRREYLRQGWADVSVRSWEEVEEQDRQIERRRSHIGGYSREVRQFASGAWWASLWVRGRQESPYREDLVNSANPTSVADVIEYADWKATRTGKDDRPHRAEGVAAYLRWITGQVEELHFPDQ